MLEAVLRRTIDRQQIRSENSRLRQLVVGEHPAFLGESDLVKELLEEAKRVARSDQPILLEGETGTGKQVLARFIHAHSENAREPLVSVNCAAITETLFESELFGHEKGAFTGAIARKPGKLELVGCGTMFLDEVGELPILCQAKLLTAVEDRTFERVGGTSSLKFDGRILAATNRNLDAEVQKGTFRKDLFYRLAGLRLRLPSLRQHSEDVPVYIEIAIQTLRRKYGRHYEMPDATTLEQLRRYAWPGNVRELLNHVERIALLSDQTEIPRRLWLAFPSNAGTEPGDVGDDLRSALDSYKKKHILGVMGRCGGNQTEAARRLGIERTHLNRLLAEFEGRR